MTTEEPKPKRPRAPRKPRQPDSSAAQAATETADAASRAASAMAELASTGASVVDLLQPEPINLYIHPPIAGEDQGEGGVGRVIRYMHRYLPNYRINIVQGPAQADVIAAHIMMPDEWPTLFPNTPIVAHIHGLYWAEYNDWPEWALKANAGVLRAIKAADVVTTPSEWVSRAVRRHTMRDAVTIYHGVDTTEWEQYRDLPRGGYVYWDKNRVDPVCSPADVERLALMLPDIQFVATSWWSDRQPPANVLVTGQLPYEKAAELMGNAGVYLAVVRETGGISVLQAMAAGVPVIGWDRAAMAEIQQLTHGLRLHPHPDYDSVAAEIRDVLQADILHERDNVAFETVREALPWEFAMARYADLYHAVVAERRRPGPRTSVIITNHNLERYLPAAVASVGAQTDQDWELIIVDDASANPDGVSNALIGYLDDPRIRILRSDTNIYLAAARNAGIQIARGRYIMPLDADDMLAPTAIQTLADALDRDSALHVAYGGVLFVDEDGSTPTNYGGKWDVGHSGWPMPMDPAQQIRGRNLLPYASMFRKSAWLQSGGYRTRCRTAEDADFWTRLVSYGFTARMVTKADTLIYRNREGSMSRSEPAVAWQDWFGWNQPGKENLAPAGMATNPARAVVPSFDPPFFSVVIPVGPGHENLAQTAIDSLEAQTFPYWECIVVWDSPVPPRNLPSWVTLKMSDYRDVSMARNAGIHAAQARHILTLDADDILQPNALAMWWQAVRTDPEACWYSDFFEDPEREGEFRIYRAPDWEPSWLSTRGTLSTSICVFPKTAWETVGGFRAALPWEDWAFQLDTAMAGICWRRIPLALYTYRKHTGGRRDQQYSSLEATKAEFAAIMGPIEPIRERIEMACGSCGRGAASSMNISEAPALREERAARLGNGQQIQMQFNGDRDSAVRFRTPSKREYWASRGDRIWALPSDVQWLEERSFVVVGATETEDVKPLAGAVRRS